MSRHDHDRLEDILEAISAIRAHLNRGALTDGLVFDAVRIRLVEIGEAVKAISPEVLRAEPEIDWQAIARFRDQLTHHYWDTTHSVVEHVVDHQLDELGDAAGRLEGRRSDACDPDD